MTNTPVIHPQTGPIVAGMAPSVAPGISGGVLQATVNRLVTVRLVSTSVETRCHFWIGLAAQGQQSPARLMDVLDMGALMTEAATTGIDDHGPVMLSDTNVTPPRYVYLMPVPETGFRERAVWIDELSQSLQAWGPSIAGFYLAPELVKSVEARELLVATLTALIQNVPTNEYVLLTGAYGLNFLLDVGLRLKADIDGEALRVAVYH